MVLIPGQPVSAGTRFLQETDYSLPPI